MGTLRALLVGIDAYEAPVPPLAGCVNDVTRMREFLEHRGGGRAAIRTLLDGEATRAEVIDAFRTHLGGAEPEDTLLFYYSGHGSQEPTPPELLAIEIESPPGDSLASAEPRSFAKPGERSTHGRARSPSQSSYPRDCRASGVDPGEALTVL